MSAARSDLCEVSPITQRSASTRLDLPQPFGPTTPVSPGSMWKSVGSTNDLKPWRRRRVSFMSGSGSLEQTAGAACPAPAVWELSLILCDLDRLAKCGERGPTMVARTGADNAESGL